MYKIAQCFVIMLKKSNIYQIALTHFSQSCYDRHNKQYLLQK